MFNQNNNFISAANMNVADMMGTPVDKLREEEHNNTQVNYDRMRQLQQMQELMNHGGANTAEDLGHNINQDLDDIGNYTPDDTQIRLQQMHELEQLRQQKMAMSQRPTATAQRTIDSDNYDSEYSEKRERKSNKKKKKRSKLLTNCIDNIQASVIEVIILVVIYYLMSSKVIREFITKHTGINVASDVKIGGVITYGILLALIFVSVRCVVNFIKNKVLDYTINAY